MEYYCPQRVVCRPSPSTTSPNRHSFICLKIKTKPNQPNQKTSIKLTPWGVWHFVVLSFCNTRVYSRFPEMLQYIYHNYKSNRHGDSWQVNYKLYITLLKEITSSKRKIFESAHFWEQSSGIIGLIRITNHIKYILVKSKGKNIYLNIRNLGEHWIWALPPL